MRPEDDPDGTIAHFVRAAGLDPDAVVECIQFAYDPRVQDELAELVAAGTKRATTALERWYTEGGERLPNVGDLFVVIDSRRAPRAIGRMTAVEIRRFAEVDAAFAWDEGEDDRSLASWRAIHERFFAEEARQNGFSFSDDSLVVLQRFERVDAER